MKRVILKLTTLIMCLAIMAVPMMASANSAVDVAIGTTKIEVGADGTAVVVPVTVTTTTTGTIDSMSLHFTTDAGITLKSAEITGYDTTILTPNHDIGTNFVYWEDANYTGVSIISPVTVNLTFTVADTSVAKDYNISLNNAEGRTTASFNYCSESYSEMSSTAGKISVGSATKTYPTLDEETFDATATVNGVAVENGSKAWTVFQKTDADLAAESYGVQVVTGGKTYKFPGKVAITLGEATEKIWGIKLIAPENAFKDGTAFAPTSIKAYVGTTLSDELVSAN